jgi:hypothetical protein
MLQQAICARARDFEIGSLLDLLATMGYRPDDICFRAHITATPHPTLLHHIEFTGPAGTIAGPFPLSSPALDLGSIAELAAEASHAAGEHRAGDVRAQVTVTVNLGLLSNRSPLPSYFQQLLGDVAIREPLIELLRIIDRNLLHVRLTCDRPERLVDRWDEITSDLLRIHGLDSLVGLHWLFRHVFPELPVTVERTPLQLRVPYSSARLGLSDLGSASFGAVTRIDVHDFQITLRCEESLLRPGVPWVHEADRRLRTVVFPALEPVCMNLTIVLELADDRAVAALSDGSGPAPDSYLGMDPLGQPGVADLPVRRVVLYRGLLPRDPLDLDTIEGELAAGTQARATAPDRVRRRSRAPTARQDDGGAAEDVRRPDELGRERELDLALQLGGRVHRYQATVRWGARAWFRDEPYAIELRGEREDPAAPTARHHPRLWRLLRDRAREEVAAELAAATLAHYGAAAVTDAIVADLLARGDDAALHALMTYGVAGDVPPEAWERFLRAQR